MGGIFKNYLNCTKSSQYKAKEEGWCFLSRKKLLIHAFSGKRRNDACDYLVIFLNVIKMLLFKFCISNLWHCWWFKNDIMKRIRVARCTVTACLLLVTLKCLTITFCSLFVTFFLLLVTFCPFFFQFYSLIFTFCSLFVTLSLLLVKCCLLYFARWFFLVACYYLLLNYYFFESFGCLDLSHFSLISR